MVNQRHFKIKRKVVTVYLIVRQFSGARFALGAIFILPGAIRGVWQRATLSDLSLLLAVRRVRPAHIALSMLRIVTIRSRLMSHGMSLDFR
ncbi:unnamed protein product [Nippostrongylus brasiliensis]|uniref:Secreted protein n=1 Tax=Nippostrongylus brasiliensis TaxID=27835 RepID=A0A0N4YPT3_NIPBR|nr:unnamed protein product [Nippostrongylus brasiliensis]